MATPTAQPIDNLARRKSYTRWRRGAAEVRAVFLVGTSVVLGLFSPVLAAASESLSPIFLLQLSAFALVNAVLLAVAVAASSIPVLLAERKFGTSRTTFRAWSRAATKSTLVLSAVLWTWLYVTYLSIHLAGGWWWVWASAGVAVELAIYVYAVPVLLLPFYYKVEPLPDGPLRDRIAELVSRAGLHIKQIQRVGYGEFTTKANALVAGFGHSRSVLISDTLLEACADDEVVALVAHEIGHTALSHIAKRVAWMSLCIMAASGATASLATFDLLPYRAGSGGLGDLANGPSLFGAMILGMFYGFVFLLRLYRRQERQADQYGWELAPELVPAFITGLAKIDARNLLYFDKQQEHKYTHPATHGRIESAEKFLQTRQRSS